MPWCPKCKTEYREGFDICADCGCALVKECPAGDSPESIVNGEAWEHLLFLYSEMEADIVMGLLGIADIPVIKIYKGMGILHKVYTGKAAGVDMFVPAEALSRAKEILKEET